MCRQIRDRGIHGIAANIVDLLGDPFGVLEFAGKASAKEVGVDVCDQERLLLFKFLEPFVQIMAVNRLTNGVSKAMKAFR